MRWVERADTAVGRTCGCRPGPIGILTALLSYQYAFIFAILVVEFSICQSGEDAFARKSEDKGLERIRPAI